MTASSTASIDSSWRYDLSQGQEQALALSPLPTGLLSIAGSVIIIRLICRHEKQFPPTFCYDRLLLFMSISDILYTIINILSPFITPSDTSARIWAFGNDTTCSVAAAFQIVGSSSLLYSTSLSFYFFFTVRKQVPDSSFAKKYEPWMHAVSLGYPLIVAVVGLPLQWFHELKLGAGCSLVGNPAIAYGALAIPLAVIFAAVTINNVLIFLHVRTTLGRSKNWRASRNYEEELQKEQAKIIRQLQEDKCIQIEAPCQDMAEEKEEEHEMDNFAPSEDIPSIWRGNGDGEEDSEEDDDDDDCNSVSTTGTTGSTWRKFYVPSLSVHMSLPSIPSVSEITRQLSPQKSSTDARLRLVSGQSLLYVLSIYLVWIWPLIQGITGTLENRTESQVFWLLIATSIFNNSQGIFNVLIYVRPRYLARRAKHADQESRWKSILKILSGSTQNNAANRFNSRSKKRSNCNDDAAASWMSGKLTPSSFLLRSPRISQVSERISSLFASESSFQVFPPALLGISFRRTTANAARKVFADTAAGSNSLRTSATTNQYSEAFNEKFKLATTSNGLVPMFVLGEPKALPEQQQEANVELQGAEISSRQDDGDAVDDNVGTPLEETKGSVDPATVSFGEEDKKTRTTRKEDIEIGLQLKIASTYLPQDVASSSSSTDSNSKTNKYG